MLARMTEKDVIRLAVMVSCVITQLLVLGLWLLVLGLGS
jgi:hypothetical protein